jgi:hypothetical protein
MDMNKEPSEPPVPEENIRQDDVQYTSTIRQDDVQKKKPKDSDKIRKTLYWTIDVDEMLKEMVEEKREESRFVRQLIRDEYNRRKGVKK